METTIQVSHELMDRLKLMKMQGKESYENIIWDLIEDRLEFSNQTKINLLMSESEIKTGKTISIEKLKQKIKARSV